MPTGEIQYELQKKTLGRWSYVTWYPTYEEAKKNFDAVTKGDTGYSWRIAKVECVEEKLLIDHVELEAPELDEIKPKKADGWGNVKSDWSSDIPSPDRQHGMTGKVWVGNPSTKEKKRVSPAEADKLLNEGWVKAGPRTVL